MSLAMSLLLFASVASAPCLDYGPATITGTLTRESVADHRTRQSVCVHFVKVDSPVCVAAGNHPKDRARERVKKLQLWHPDKLGYEQAHELNGQRVTCEGALFGRRNDHHHTPVLLHGTCVAGEDGT